MPKHYDVHLVYIAHVIVEDDGMDEPEWVAIGQATEDFWALRREFQEFVSDKEDVYPVEPCDCGEPMNIRAEE